MVHHHAKVFRESEGTVLVHIHHLAAEGVAKQHIEA